MAGGRVRAGRDHGAPRRKVTTERALTLAIAGVVAVLVHATMNVVAMV